MMNSEADIATMLARLTEFHRELEGQQGKIESVSFTAITHSEDTGKSFFWVLGVGWGKIYVCGVNEQGEEVFDRAIVGFENGYSREL